MRCLGRMLSPAALLSYFPWFCRFCVSFWVGESERVFEDFLLEMEVGSLGDEFLMIDIV